VIEAFLSRALLAAIRIGGLMTFAPFFGNGALPNPVKAVLTLTLTVLVLPVYATGTAPTAASFGSWAGMGLSELVMGMMAGLATQFVFDGMELGGQIVGFQFGFSLANVIDPNSQVEITVLSSLYELVALLVFMNLGVHRAILRAIAVSFQMVPLGSLENARLPASELLRMSGAMWLVGAEIAFPVLLATLLVDLTIGFVTKASPQFPALFVGLSMKILLGLALLYATVEFWPQLLERYFSHAVSGMERLLTIAH
jgi:flagellar biosynthetic protein FliR